MLAMFAGLGTMRTSYLFVIPAIIKYATTSAVVILKYRYKDGIASFVSRREPIRKGVDQEGGESAFVDHEAYSRRRESKEGEERVRRVLRKWLLRNLNGRAF